MSYRTQEILRMIIPGLYLIAMVLILFFIGGGWGRIATPEQNTIIDVMKGASNVVVLLLPFLGFVVGYIIECIMSICERLLYWLGIPRPSRMVLKGCKMYLLDNTCWLRRELGVGSTITNDQAGKALQKAKLAIQRQSVETFHDSSILARNILGSQLMLTIYTIYNDDWFPCEFWIMLLLFMLLSIYWYHKNCIYVKYVLSEYEKTIKSSHEIINHD